MKKTEQEILLNNETAKRWDKDMETWMAYAARLHIPMDGTFELTARCNLSCKMCYIRLSRQQAAQIGRERTAAEWIGMGREALEAGCVYLLLTGGEPLLHPEFCEIYEALAQMGFIITIFTNATLIDDKVASLFEKYPPMHIKVTLYGASRETYHRICGNPDAFDLTIAGLDRLSLISTKLGIRTTFIKDNAGDMEALYNLAMHYTNEYQVNPEVFKTFGKNDRIIDECRLSPQEVVAFDERYLQFLLVKLRENGYNEITKSIFDPRIKKSGYELEPVILECLAGKASFSINWEGKMFACNTFSTHFTNPFHEGFSNAFQRLPELFKDLQKPEKCLSCELGKQSSCPNCPPKLFAETGSYVKTSDYICEYSQKRREVVLRRQSTPPKYN